MERLELLQADFVRIRFRQHRSSTDSRPLIVTSELYLRKGKPGLGLCSITGSVGSND